MTTAGFIGLVQPRRRHGPSGSSSFWRADHAVGSPLSNRSSCSPARPRSFAADPVELGRASDVVGICVTDGAAVRAVTLGPHGVLAGMAAGSVLALHSTIGTDECAEIAEAAAATGVDVIDAPVSGGGV